MYIRTVDIKFNYFIMTHGFRCELSVLIKARIFPNCKQYKKSYIRRSTVH